MFPSLLIRLCHHIGCMLDQTFINTDPGVPLFRLNGLYSGPRLAVTGPDAMMRDVADMFWNRPDLAVMRGALILRADHVEPCCDLADHTMAISIVSESVQVVFSQILGRMSALGMLAEQDEPNRWVA